MPNLAGGQRKTLVTLLQEILAGQVALEKFLSRWPKDALGIRVFPALFDDAEDAVEHMPGYLLSSGVDLSKWRSSPPFFKVVFDLALLQTSWTDTRLLAAHKLAARTHPRSEEDLNEISLALGLELEPEILKLIRS